MTTASTVYVSSNPDIQWRLVIGGGGGGGANKLKVRAISGPSSLIIFFSSSERLVNGYFCKDKTQIFFHLEILRLLPH